VIGIVIPAHNEERYLDGCLNAIRLACGHPDLRGESVNVVVVLDHCGDGSPSPIPSPCKARATG